MAGTKLGGLKARDTNLKNNPDFYKEIGKLGGSEVRDERFCAQSEISSPGWR